MKDQSKSIVLVGATVLLLNIGLEKYRWSLLFYPLYPGILAHFFIEGAHGTSPHPVQGFIVEVAVNMLTYILIYLSAVSLLRRMN